MKVSQITFVLVWTLIACISNSLAQNSRFDHFDTRKGLSQNNVYSLIVDSTGYIWVGTLEGLTRFDGKEFKIVHSSPVNTNSLQESHIDEISACPNGNIWILTRQGEMRLYDASTEKFIFFPDSCFSPARTNLITSMVSASNSSLWFTDNKGLYRFNLPNLKTTKYNVPFSGGFIQTFGKDDLLYWGQGGIFQLAPALSEGRNLQQLYSNPVQTISRVFNDSLLIVCSDSVLIFNLKQKKNDVLTTNNRLKEALKNTRIISAAGYKDEIWLGLSDGLVLIHYQNGVQDVSKFTYDPYNNHSFHGKDAKSLAFDRAGNLWIGTSKYGISLYGREKNLFKHHQISVLSKADQEIDPVRSLCKTRDGSVWVGFDRSGLVRTSPDNQQILYNDIHFPNGKTSPIARVRSLHEDSRGNLWIGTNQGLCIYNSDHNVVEAVSLAFGWEWPSVCYFMKEFDSGKLTITNNQGIGIVDLQKKTLRELPFPDNQLSPIRSMVRDKNNNYWIILDNIGLFKLSPDYKITNFNSEPNYLTNSKLYTLEITADILWIASSSGLLAFDLNTEKVVSTYHESDGLSNNLVYGIIADANYLWLSTNRGLSRMILTNKHFESFLPDDLFMDDAYYKDNKGVIYFGGYDGYIDFNPQTFQREQITPKPILTQLSLNNQRISVGDQVNDKTILPVSLQKMNLLQMDYGPNSFALAFDAFPFNYPDRTYFRYRLNGLSPEWMYAANNENRAVFANLDPGNYDFEVEASLNGKNWSKPTTLSVEIIPPFWQEPWFEIMLVVTLLILGIALFQMRVYAIKRWNNQLKSKVAEQTQSIEKQKK
ncbi:ligand-binding sensor domain-containing protein [Gaoshiqia sediminis]|uniref:Two component regulator three Y domain-containing protein n=1 Tax=Gaoshiqia sediminis TaxID=2986998 RepID=A0AA41Y999_9BACT|nr:two-component regulator propeller domain-containing protein [Gaoshiqia sediminis]MCW0483941.1 hypothetical protein [Gaoshiqia sediminis]